MRETTGDEKTLLLNESDVTEIIKDSGATEYLGNNGDFSKGTSNQKIQRELYHLEEGAILQGRYKIGDILGFGGFGITYSAWDSKLEVKVAIKEYYPSSLVNRIPGEMKVEVFSPKRQSEFEKGVERFLEEAQNMAQFSGEPNIVNVYNYFKENGTAYLVMEYLDGMSLKEFTQRNGDKLPYTVVIQYTKCLIAALKTLHKKNILHRDISPDNIFVCRNGNVKLIDFGAARFAMETDEEKTLSVILKPGYAPIEQYRSKGKQGPWTDIYALGATMYRTLTGVVPDESVNRAVKDTLKEPSEYVPGIPQYLNNILMKCMAVLPELRFQSVAELEKKLDNHTTVKTVQKELKARRIRRVALAGVLVLLLAGVGYREYHYIVEQKEKATLVESTVEVWLPVKKDDDKTEKVFEESIADFKATYPFVTIKTECIPEEEYEEKLNLAMISGNGPDVFESSFLRADLKDKLADLSDVYDLLQVEENSTYRFSGQFISLFEKKELPTGFMIPLAFKNTMIKKGSDVNDINKFCKGKTSEYVGTLEDYAKIQDSLAGIYEIDSDNSAGIAEFVNVWGVNQTSPENEINAGERLLYYLMSEQAQDIWFVQNGYGFPLDKSEMDILVQINPELNFLNEIDSSNIKIEQIDKEKLDEIYQAD